LRKQELVRSVREKQMRCLEGSKGSQKDWRGWLRLSDGDVRLHVAPRVVCGRCSDVRYGGNHATREAVVGTLQEDGHEIGNSSQECMSKAFSDNFSFRLALWLVDPGRDQRGVQLHPIPRIFLWTCDYEA
jgi:hypothetical protein